MKILTKILYFFVLVCLTYQTIAQEISLQDKYTNLIRDSETYAQYKMIPQTSLNSFWSETMDSLSQSKKILLDLKNQIVANESMIESLNSQILTTQTELVESLNQNDSIGFLGMSFSKTSYHIIVWSFIVMIAVLAMISYLSFVRSNKMTAQFKKDYKEITAEFENHKDKAREQQMKLKRELQTAVNQLSERR